MLTDKGKMHQSKPMYNDTLSIGKPHFCDITIATHCNLHCKMCKAWHAPADGPHLSFEESRHFIDSLAEFVETPLEINVMGGEPLLVPWCLDLCNYISEKGFRSIISTNASLIDEAMAKRIADSKLSVLAISLESITAAMHDTNRGKQGLHRQIMQAIEYLDKYARKDLCVTLLTILMEKNIDEIIPLAEWVNTTPLFQNISYLALLETGLVSEHKNWFRQDVYKDLWPQNKGQLNAVIDELIRLRKEGYRIWNPLSQLDAFKEYYEEPDLFMKQTPCKLHDYIIDLDENANIYLSGEMLGNLREDNLRTLWYSEKAQHVRKKIQTEGPGERCCVINFVCAFPADDVYLKVRENT
ncbi:MAG: radical SAM protein [Candidatus Omnitrophica bacterium]|nr:radical SAM protein [Candidatus Omnitrophota bacterium]